MAREMICRVWYGKRFGNPESFKDIDDFCGAARLATLVMADRIEVIRRPLTIERKAMATEERPSL